MGSDSPKQHNRARVRRIRKSLRARASAAETVQASSEKVSAHLMMHVVAALFYGLRPHRRRALRAVLARRCVPISARVRSEEGAPPTGGGSGVRSPCKATLQRNGLPSNAPFLTRASRNGPDRSRPEGRSLNGPLRIVAASFPGVPLLGRWRTGSLGGGAPRRATQPTPMCRTVRPHLDCLLLEIWERNAPPH
jgi:hypothetical protein